jgi:mono/diheme cytochrome c family protein
MSRGYGFRGVLWAGLAAAVILPAWLAWGQAGDAVYGKEMLEVRHCTSCHAVEGAGGTTAPDLGRPSPQDISPAGVVAALWNHAPQMWEQMDAKNIPIPTLSWLDVSNLYAYMYSVRFVDPAGDAARGATVFSSRNCATCHDLKPDPDGKIDEQKGPPVSRWLSMADPIQWTQQMWNHSAVMGERIEQQGSAWPEFTLQEMTDLLAHLKSLPELGLINPGMRLGDSLVGAQLFDTKRCSECHSIGPGGESKIDLINAARSQPRLSGLAVAMWNHRPAMKKAAEEKGIQLEAFEHDEMADLLTFLFERGYFSTPGDPAGGEAVYQKACARCHDTGEASAPALRGVGLPFTASRLGSAVWVHGPNMKAQMDYRDQAWPRLTEKQAADLIVYLNSQ